MSSSDINERRKYARVKLNVPVEIHTGDDSGPIRGATADLSLNGCYIETMFPFPIGTNLDLQLSIESIILVAARVVSYDPQVGNGITFVTMLPEDREALKTFLEAAQESDSTGTGPAAH
jgi:c-di-GMP-binding flagellar brake protein YcgR